MITNLGDFATGSTVYIPFHTFDSNDPSASVTITGLAVTDIEVYKDGSVTQRASDNGYTLLDTDGTDFDGITGLHGISIDLSDNSDAGFYAAGSTYWVAISAITVDAATINFWAGIFTIARTGGTATVLTDTEAILTDSEAILTDSEAILVDTEASQTAETSILADTEASQTAETSILADTEAVLTDSEAILVDTEAATVAAIADQVWEEAQVDHATAGTFGEIATEIASVLTDSEAILTDSEAVLADTEAAVPVLTDTEAILADTEAATTTAIADAVWDESTVGHTTAGTFGEQLKTDVDAVLVDTEAVLADTEAAAPVLTDTEAILADTEAAATSHTTIITDTEALLVDTEAVIIDTEAVLADTEAAVPVLTDTEAILTDSEAILADSEAVIADTESLGTGIITGAAVTGTLSTTQASTDLTGYADDQLIGRIVIWTSGAADGEATDITDFAETNGVLTFTALTTAPGNGDTFKIV